MKEGPISKLNYTIQKYPPFSLISYIWTHPSNQNRRFRALARAVAWQFYKRITGKYWDIKLVGNRKIRCYPNNTSASSVLYAGLFDYDEMRFLLRYLRPSDNFLDVGANIGVYTVLASSVVTLGEIHAFEPSSGALKRLRENVQINRLANIHIHDVAVSNHNGKEMLTRDKDSMNHLIKEGNIQYFETVTSVRLQEEVGGIKFAMGKMDIEGAELMALNGAVGMLEAHNPPVLFMEVSDLLQRFGSTKSDLIRYLEQYGYIPAVYYEHDNRLLRDDETWKKRNNAILVSKYNWREVEERLMQLK